MSGLSSFRGHGTSAIWKHVWKCMINEDVLTSCLPSKESVEVFPHRKTTHYPPRSLHTTTSVGRSNDEPPGEELDLSFAIKVLVKTFSSFLMRLHSVSQMSHSIGCLEERTWESEMLADCIDVCPGLRIDDLLLKIIDRGRIGAVANLFLAFFPPLFPGRHDSGCGEVA